MEETLLSLVRDNTAANVRTAEHLQEMRTTLETHTGALGTHSGHLAALVALKTEEMKLAAESQAYRRHVVKVVAGWAAPILTSLILGAAAVQCGIPSARPATDTDVEAGP